MLDFPYGDQYAVALVFDVVQTEPDGAVKVRGCSDWSRGGQNATQSFTDRLRTQGLDDVVATLQLGAGTGEATPKVLQRFQCLRDAAEERARLRPLEAVRKGSRVTTPERAMDSSEESDALLWCADHKDAYKQLPGNPPWALVGVLVTPTGVKQQQSTVTIVLQTLIPSRLVCFSP